MDRYDNFMSFLTLDVKDRAEQHSDMMLQYATQVIYPLLFTKQMVKPEIMRSDRSDCLNEFTFNKFDFDLNIDSHKGFKKFQKVLKEFMTTYDMRTSITTSQVGLKD